MDRFIYKPFHDAHLAVAPVHERDGAIFSAGAMAAGSASYSQCPLASECLCYKPEYRSTQHSGVCIASPRSAYKHALARATNHSSKALLYHGQASQNCLGTNAILDARQASLGHSDMASSSSKCRSVPASHLLHRSVLRSKNYVHAVSVNPDKVLDAPGLLDDFYLSLLDWGQTEELAVALGSRVYVWHSLHNSVKELFHVKNDDAKDYISSLKWAGSQHAHLLSTGLSNGAVELWDASGQRKLRTFMHQPEALNFNDPSLHPNRVSSLAWNGHVITSGSRTGDIYHSDIRVSANHVVKVASAHSMEVCGLAWSNDGGQLASGANDNIVCIWDEFKTTPIHSFTHHRAAVKAMAWCPWRNRLLATGGGSADKTIRTWNTSTGSCLSTTHTGSQVTSLLWSSEDYRELISSHGYPNNQLTVWRHPTMTKLKELKSHYGRVLGLTISPDGKTVVSVGADENINFWNIYPNASTSLAHSRSRKTRLANPSAQNTRAPKRCRAPCSVSPLIKTPCSASSFSSSLSNTLKNSLGMDMGEAALLSSESSPTPRSPVLRRGQRSFVST